LSDDVMIRVGSLDGIEGDIRIAAI